MAGPAEPQEFAGNPYGSYSFALELSGVAVEEDDQHDQRAFGQLLHIAVDAQHAHDVVPRRKAAIPQISFAMKIQ